jgi:hypothetical protein
MMAPPTAIGALRHKVTVALVRIDLQKRVSNSNLLGFGGLPLYVMSVLTRSGVWSDNATDGRFSPVLKLYLM